MEDRLIQLLSELAGINSINPTLSHGPREQEISEFVAQYVKRIGLEAEMQPVASKRNNVVSVIPGPGRGNPLLLNAHLDTVGVDEMDDPFTLKREGDRLYGRGAYDMKGSIAIMLLLAEYLTRHSPPLTFSLPLWSMRKIEA